MNCVFGHFWIAVQSVKMLQFDSNCLLIYAYWGQLEALFEKLELRRFKHFSPGANFKNKF